MIKALPDIYAELSRIHKIPVGMVASPLVALLMSGDFPSVEEYQMKLEAQDFKKFKDLSPKMITTIEEILTRELPRFMKLTAKETDVVDDEVPTSYFSLSLSQSQALNPFSDAAQWEWDVEERFAFEQKAVWNTLSPSGEPLNGQQLKEPLMSSGAPPVVRLFLSHSLTPSGVVKEDLGAE